ncbi:CD3324 family protein [Brevibacillus fluminis]|uniref:CD3324 family protein n=1 Tax=Brevibacillus fluminis TaxID=511487 RepID=UPI003F8C6E0E
MKYQNASTILPKELLARIQDYVQGGYLYIPVRQEKKKRWGERTRAKEIMRERNEAIVEAYRQGHSVKALAGRHFLTEHSIRRIIRDNACVQSQD